MVNSEDVQDHGLGVKSYHGSSPDVVAKLIVSHYRFLDFIFLPLPLAKLSAEQIEISNRLREHTFDQDAQFARARHARSAVTSALKRLQSSDVLEIGCGKFPIVDEYDFTNYRAIDIDPEAIAYCVTRSIKCTHPSQFHESPSTADAVIAIYSLHFSITPDLLSIFSGLSSGDAIFMASLLLDDADHLLRVLGLLESTWGRVCIVKHPNMARREVFLLSSGPTRTDDLLLAEAATRSYYDTIKPSF